MCTLTKAPKSRLMRGGGECSGDGALLAEQGAQRARRLAHRLGGCRNAAEQHAVELPPHELDEQRHLREVIVKAITSSTLM